MERGLCPGEPLSLFCFVLSLKLYKFSPSRHAIVVYYKGSLLLMMGPNLSLLQYANDALFFGKWSLTNAQNFIRILRAPIKVLHTFENICRHFFWGFKDEFKGKWKWRFHMESETLWCKVVKAIHGPNGGFGIHSSFGLHKGVWANIVSNNNAIDKCGNPFSSSIMQKIRDGRDVMLWNDVWLECGVRLKDEYPVWRSDLRGRSIDDLTELSNRLSTICLVNGIHDRWQWCLACNNHFFINHLSKLVDSKVLDQFALGLSSLAFESLQESSA
ncbi:hypothetical protein Tco_0992926 [Tanacetum coccineum]|uniref:Reverse transcriptase zinc-binding domain-containing protein n=1 Tax=Tanacetum coccineum TaxID=301880 RepID=A0ABQ5F3S4_9ASTR